MRPGRIWRVLPLGALVAATACRDPPSQPGALAGLDRKILRVSAPRVRDTAPDDAARAGAEVCPVHGLAVLRDMVPVRYGRPYIPEGEDEASDLLFPLANSVYRGGCFEGDETQRAVTYCRACRATEVLYRQNPSAFAQAIERERLGPRGEELRRQEREIAEWLSSQERLHRKRR